MPIVPRTPVRLSLLLSLLVPGTALAQTAPERLTGPVPEEVAAYEAALQRFRDRTDEFSGDARAIVDQLEREQRAKIDQGYKGVINELDLEKRALRAEAIRRFEGFLAKYPDASESAHVMFRLADLYYEVAREDYFLAQSEYDMLLNETADEDIDSLPPSPALDQSRSIALYKRILQKFPDYQYTDGTLYMLGYSYSNELSIEQKEPDAEEIAKGYFEQLVTRFPDSQFAVEGNFKLGEYYFANNDIELAVPYFQAVVAKAPPENATLGNGVYMLAWSYYKLSDYDQAMALFTRLLDDSARDLLETGRVSNVRPEAIEYSALTIWDLADKSTAFTDPLWMRNATPQLVDAADALRSIGLGQRSSSPIEVYEAWYNKVGRRAYEPEVLIALADVCKQSSRLDLAIDVYKHYQKKWPNDPKNAEYQFEVARLYLNLYPPDEVSANAALAELNERYNEDSSWAQSNRNNPDAINQARGYIEESLYNVATELHARAQATGNTDDYSKAADRYREYLQKFPFADNYFQVEWYLADALFFSERYPEAIAEYEQLLKYPGHSFVDAATYQLFKAEYNVILKSHGGFDRLPQNAVIERTVPNAKGGERNIYMLNDDYVQFIAAADKLRAAKLTDPEYAEAKQRDMAALYYLPAQVLFYHGRYDEARERLEELIELYPKTDEAAWGARLVVNSYVEEGNLEQVLAKSVEYKNARLGKDPALAMNNDTTFGDFEEDSAFKIALKRKEQGDLLGAAEAFMQYTETYKKSDNVPLALYNAANCYEEAGRADKANELFERYLTQYPRDKFSEGLYYRIATNYASILDLDKSIQYYERLYQYFPKNVDAPAALYMAGFLRTGKGDYRGAAENFEVYVKRFPNEPDAEIVYWLAGEQWLKISDAEALKFYERYLARFPKENPDHVLQAKHWTATYYTKKGDTKKADAAWKALTTTYLDLVKAGTVGPAGRHYAAQAAFRDLQATYDAFIVIKYPKDEDAKAKLLLETKRADLDNIERMSLSLIEVYADFEYSSAAIYLWGSAYLQYAEMLYKAPPPANFTEEMVALYRETLDGLARPVEEKGVNRLKANLQKAKDEKRSSVWIDKSIQLLNEYDPSGYPLEKPETRGTADSSVVPSAGPLDPKPAEEPKASGGTP